ncbi:hypothetical protein Tco_1515764 [Tanacetum coccineum]
MSIRNFDNVRISPILHNSNSLTDKLIEGNLLVSSHGRFLGGNRLVSRAKAEDIASPAALAPLASDYILASSDYIPVSNTKIEPFRHLHHRITHQGAIAKEIDAPPYKRCRSSSPPKPSPPSSPSPPPAMLPPYKSSLAARILPVIGEPIHRTIPLLVVRLVHPERKIQETQDHLEELPLERFEALDQDIEGHCDDMMTS